MTWRDNAACRDADPIGARMTATRTDGRFVRRTASSGASLGPWHVALPLRTVAGGRRTACGVIVSTPWPEWVKGWTFPEWSDYPPLADLVCGRNGCRQRFESMMGVTA